MTDKVPVSIKGGIGRKPRKEKTKKSNFLLTVSTNQRYKSDDKNKPADEEAFDETVREMLGNLPAYVNVNQEGTSWSPENIKDVDIDYAIETGEKTGALHAHILLKIQHNTKVTLNYDAIKKKICGDLGLDNVYLYNRLVRPSSDQWLEEYLDKNR